MTKTQKPLIRFLDIQTTIDNDDKNVSISSQVKITFIGMCSSLNTILYLFMVMPMPKKQKQKKKKNFRSQIVHSTHSFPSQTICSIFLFLFSLIGESLLCIFCLFWCLYPTLTRLLYVCVWERRKQNWYFRNGNDAPFCLYTKSGDGAIICQMGANRIYKIYKSQNF